MFSFANSQASFRCNWCRCVRICDVFLQQFQPHFCSKLSPFSVFRVIISSHVHILPRIFAALPSFLLSFVSCNCVLKLLLIFYPLFSEILSLLDLLIDYRLVKTPVIRIIYLCILNCSPDIDIPTYLLMHKHFTHLFSHSHIPHSTTTRVTAYFWTSSPHCNFFLPLTLWQPQWWTLSTSGAPP